MSGTHYPSYRKQLIGGLAAMRADAPDVMTAFNELHRASLADGSLSTATKELIALAIGVAARCEGCIAFHVSAALRAGATREQIVEALGVAVMMGGGPATMYAAEAFAALEQYERAS
ncbi:MAG: carboxymuconolactone decarboxylase family protein [Actinomycetota bacterium]